MFYAWNRLDRLERLCTAPATTGFKPESKQDKHDLRPYKMICWISFETTLNCFHLETIIMG